MKNLFVSSLLLLGVAVPGYAQQVLPETCHQQNTTYHPETGFCIYSDRPNVFTTTHQNILLDIRQDSDTTSYMVQAYDLAAENLLLAVVVNGKRQPTRFLVGDAVIIESYQDPINVGLDLLESR